MMYSMRIADVLQKRINRDWLLPSMQREFVWKRKEKRIEKLFDSIMQDYPFGSVLVWKVAKETVAKMDLYEFVCNYDEENPHNVEPATDGYNEFGLILDGQQRLSALNIGLRGSYSYTYYGRDVRRLLCLNLFSTIDDADDTDGLKYEFEFKSETEIPEDDENNLWIRVGAVMAPYNDESLSKDRKQASFSKGYRERINQYGTTDDKKDEAFAILNRLYNQFCEREILNVESVENTDDEAVLNIFVRLNDGGMRLEKSDLLLAYMQSGKELFLPDGARKEVHGFVDLLNKERLHKPEYDFKKDDVLKACLVLSELDVKYKISNFTSANLNVVSDKWIDIKKYLELTVELISRYGFSRVNVTSKNALIPIAYYLDHHKKSRAFVESEESDDLYEKGQIIRWLVTSQLTGLFGGSSDTTLQAARSHIKSGKSFAELMHLLQGGKLSKDHLASWVDRESYGSRYSHLLLMLLTDSKYWDECEQDHIFPISKFNNEEYKKLGLIADQITFYEKNANCISNLHLLSKSVNIKKSDTDFIDWSNNQNAIFLEASSIPDRISYDFSNFQQFVEKRRVLILDKLSKKLL